MFHHTHTCPCPHLCPCHPGASTAQPGLWSDPTVTAPLSQAPKIFVHVSPAAVIQQPQEPPVPGAAPTTSGPSQGTALPGAPWDSPSRAQNSPGASPGNTTHGTARAGAVSRHHSQSPAPGTAHPALQPHAQLEAPAGTRATPSHAKGSSTVWAVGESSHVSWKNTS